MLVCAYACAYACVDVFVRCVRVRVWMGLCVLCVRVCVPPAERTSEADRAIMRPYSGAFKKN